MAELHQLIQDNDCHWYVVPVVYLDTFREMMKCEWDEITEDGYAMLDEWRVDGPHAVSFMWDVRK